MIMIIITANTVYSQPICGHFKDQRNDLFLILGLKTNAPCLFVGFHLIDVNDTTYEDGLWFNMSFGIIPFSQNKVYN